MWGGQNLRTVLRCAIKTDEGMLFLTGVTGHHADTAAAATATATATAATSAVTTAGKHIRNFPIKALENQLRARLPTEGVLSRIGPHVYARNRSE